MAGLSVSAQLFAGVIRGVSRIESLTQIPEARFEPGSWLVLDVDDVLVQGRLATGLSHFDKDIPQWITRISGKKIETMALTHRDPDQAKELSEALTEMGYSFTLREQNFAEYPFLGKATRLPVFTNGIFLVGQWRSKGEEFSHWLRRQGWNPPKVIFVDNTLENLVDVGNWLDEMGISYEGYWLIDSSVPVPCGWEIVQF